MHDQVPRTGKSHHPIGEPVIENTDLGQDPEGVPVVAWHAVAVGGDHVVGQVDADLGGGLHQVAAPVRVRVVFRQQRSITLRIVSSRRTRSSSTTATVHQRRPPFATRRR